jgi:hypothetical protein
MPPKAKAAPGNAGDEEDQTAAPATPTGAAKDPEEMNTENWEDNKESFLYINASSGKLEAKNLKTGGVGQLFTIDGMNADGQRVLIEVWGDTPARLFQRMFLTAAEKNQSLFRIHPINVVNASDSDTLILMPVEPNSFQERYKKVYKLQTRAKIPGYVTKRNPKMTNWSFPKPVTWRPDAFTFSNGDVVPPPNEWGQERLTYDESQVDFASLLEEEDIPSTPNKKQRAK